MSIAEQIKSDVGTAMKAGDRERSGALRLILAELQKDAKEGPGDEQAVLRRERKRRKDAETAFRDAGRTELADKEAAEGALIETYLPQQLTDAELENLVTAAIEETNAQSMRDMGGAIKHVMAAAQGRADVAAAFEKEYATGEQRRYALLKDAVADAMVDLTAGFRAHRAEIAGDKDTKKQGENEERKADAKDELAAKQEQTERKAAEVENLERKT